MSEIQNHFYDHILTSDQKEYPRGKFDCFPAFPFAKEKMNKGYAWMAQKIAQDLPNGLRLLVVDGYQGVNWERFKKEITSELATKNITPEWIDMQHYQASGEEIAKRAEPFMGGDDRIFGTHYPFGMEIFFDAAKMAKLRIQASKTRAATSGKLTIIYGYGAGLIELWDQLWYIDYPKDFAQEKARNGAISNFGIEKTPRFETFYKRSYFVEWPAMNRQKKQLLPHINLLIDGQNEQEPTTVSGQDFNSILHRLAETPFRLRPWFYPGPWGGKFMQGHMGLDPEQPNFAWSFEMIVPENGIVTQQGDERLEFSFDFLMYAQNSRIMGQEAARQFKYEWPIRLDYLDTIDGGNLSTQVHPRPDYIRKHFGETYTQDETYYIVKAQEKAKVYLGLTEECDIDAFKRDLEHSAKEGTEVDIDKYVHSEEAQAHGLYLIPNGTVHCSGTGNLVLEISATPYIFTFKIYDYLRRDLEGNLRPINIERGFENIRPERRAEYVKEHLVAKEYIEEQGAGWKKIRLYDAPFTFYTVHRIEFDESYEMVTGDSGYAINLVEGENIELQSENGTVMPLNYLESMLIPAASGRVKMINRSDRTAKLVLVRIRPGTGTDKALNDPQDG